MHQSRLGYPMLIEVRAGPFSGCVRDEHIGGFQRFLGQLDALYHTLSGSAELCGYENFQLTMTGNGHGGIGVSVVVIGGHDPHIQLKFAYDLDQTYLPPIIQSIRREFPAAGLAQKS